MKVSREQYRRLHDEDFPCDPDPCSGLDFRVCLWLCVVSCVGVAVFAVAFGGWIWAHPPPLVSPEGAIF